MANAALKRRRPKYLSLAALVFQLRLPLPGKVSILHRISGALLVFPLAAWLLYLLDQSLASEEIGRASCREKCRSGGRRCARNRKQQCHRREARRGGAGSTCGE